MAKMLTICCVTVLLLAVALGLWPSKPKIALVAQQTREHRSQPSTSPRAPEGNRPLPTASPAASTDGPRQRQKTAKDYFQLALSILPQAKAGNAEAEFVLYKTFRQCHTGLEAYYAGQFDTAEKATADAAVRNHSTEEAERLHRKCHGFFTSAASALGDPWEWLQKATEVQYPAAQADTASERLLQDRLKVFAPPGTPPSDIGALPPIGGDADPRALLASALPSGDPEVLASIGQLQRVLHPHQAGDVTHLNRVAWLYVACERGNDCSGLGPTSPINCAATDTHCLGVPAVLMLMAHDNWAPVQDAVDKIDAELNAQRWTDLGQYIN